MEGHEFYVRCGRCRKEGLAKGGGVKRYVLGLSTASTGGGSISGVGFLCEGCYAELVEGLGNFFSLTERAGTDSLSKTALFKSVGNSVRNNDDARR